MRLWLHLWWCQHRKIQLLQQVRVYTYTRSSTYTHTYGYLPSNTPDNRYKNDFFFRCPAYYNLPPQCTLTKKTGECCLQPVCNFNPQYQTQTGQKVTNVNGVSEYLSIDIYWRKLHVFKIIQHIQIISVFKIHVWKSYIIQQCIPTKNNGIRN